VRQETSPSSVSDDGGYERHFGLAEPPFAPASSGRFLFESWSGQAALEEISRGLRRHDPVFVITGAAGTGKTTLCRVIDERCGPRTLVATLHTPPRDVGDLLRQVLDGFGVLTGDSREVISVSHVELLKTLRQFLRSLLPLNAQAMIVFDEAQELPLEMLEQILLLSNLKIEDDRQLLQIVLVGRPELDDRLARQKLAHTDQRIARSYRLQPLDQSEVSAYISHRLQAAESGDSAEGRPSFSAAALGAIARLSQGVPRVVNTLCHHVLESAWQDRTHAIDEARVLRVGRSLELDVPPPIRVRNVRRHARVAVVAAVVLVAALLLWMRGASTSVAAGPFRPSSGVTASAPATVPIMPPPSPTAPPASLPASPQTTPPRVAAARSSGTRIVPVQRGPAAAASPSAAKPVVKLQDASLEELLDRAVVLRQQPNVRALQQIADEVVRRQHAATPDTSGEFEAVLDRLDRDLTEARRRQLEEDGRRLGANAR
jgi:general secretion pathway protein A